MQIPHSREVTGDFCHLLTFGHFFKPASEATFGQHVCQRHYGMIVRHPRVIIGKCQREKSMLLRVEDDVEEHEAGGGEDDVVAEEELDPEGGVAFAGEDRCGCLHHG